MTDPRRFPARGSSIPKVLARIGNLELLARTVVDGFINGLHRAPYFGASVDFAEHRGYVPGDDIRRVDWRLYARTDRYYIKEYEADSNTNFSVLLDVSKSMGFGSRGITKLDYAQDRSPPACLPRAPAARPRRHHHLRRRHRRRTCRRRPSTWTCVLHTLDRAEAERPGSLQAPLHKLAEHFGRRGILVADLGLLRGARGDPRGASSRCGSAATT